MSQFKRLPVNKNSSQDFLESSDDAYFSGSKNLFGGEGQLSCDVYQDKENIIIKTTIAGVEAKNLDIAVKNDLLTIRGFRQMDEEIAEENFYTRECYWGTFSRSIVLPQEVNQTKSKATLKNGVLTIILPKKYKTTSISIRRFDS